MALYRAPEGAWRASQQNRFKLDVQRGRVAAYLLTGAPPAGSVPELRSLLVSSGGVDVSVAAGGVRGAAAGHSPRDDGGTVQADA
ncbi:hypothetical protein GY12_16080 [Micrococcus luteus]|nr:hypothetical protein GY12_16080 [Micrococcus luteus]